MKKKYILPTGIAVVGMLLPCLSFASGLDDEVKSLHTVLEGIYDDMIKQVSQLTTVSRAIAGFAAMWYIAARVWRHLANAEPIDFYPLLRPFAIGIAIGAFPVVIAILNGVLKPTETGTEELLKTSNNAIAILIKQKEDALKESTVWKAYVGESGTGDRAEWYKYTHPEDSTGTGEKWYSVVGNSMQFTWEKALYNFKNQIKVLMSEILSILYSAASLCINTIRTFYLIVLAMLGPLVFAFATFDGFTSGIANWLGRYVNVYLWLPVANIFGAIIGKIQENMLKIDISQVKQYGDSFFSTTDAGYLIFMVIAIVGYTTVPSVANYIVQASGASAMMKKVTNMATSSASNVAGMAGTAGGNLAGAPISLARGAAGEGSLTSNLGAALGKGLASLGGQAGKQDDTLSKADKIKGPKEG